jgi:hypothetical protein
MDKMMMWLLLELGSAYKQSIEDGNAPSNFNEKCLFAMRVILCLI